MPRRGVNAATFERLLRVIGRIPQNWEVAKETFSQAEARRARLAGKLRSLAAELRRDPEVSSISFSPSLAAYTGLPDTLDVMLTFPDLMDIEASLLEGSDKPYVKLSDNSASD